MLCVVPDSHARRRLWGLYRSIRRWPTFSMGDMTPRARAARRSDVAGLDGRRCGQEDQVILAVHLPAGRQVRGKSRQAVAVICLHLVAANGCAGSFVARRRSPSTRYLLRPRRPLCTLSISLRPRCVVSVKKRAPSFVTSVARRRTTRYAKRRTRGDSCFVAKYFAE